MIGWTFLALYYIIGLVVVRWRKPFYGWDDVLMAAPFWPMILWL